MGFGEAVVALNLGLIDASAIADPVWSKNKAQFRALVAANDVLTPLCNVIGLVTAAAAATKGDFIRAIIRGRRKAVEFMGAHPDEAADIAEPGRRRRALLGPGLSFRHGPYDTRPKTRRRAFW
jgi:NitT/TauT family transport system substrate-binding protein